MNVIQDNAELLAENVRLLQRDLEAEARAGPDPAEEAVPLQEAPKEGGAVVHGLKRLSKILIRAHLSFLPHAEHFLPS
jgi:hypothetical protein